MVQYHCRFFGQKLPNNGRAMNRGIVMMQDPSIGPKFRSSPTNSLTHVTLPIFPNNNAGSLFNLVQETQTEQRPCDKKK
jgi:hypothetical protein